MAFGSTADLVVRIITDSSKASAGVDQATSKYAKFRSGVHTAAIGATAVLGGLTAAAISFGKAAADDEQSQALLANAMKNGAGASKDQIANMETWIDKASRASGVADDELRPAMSDLVRATGDATKAQKDMQTAMDIAAATGKPLETVTKAIAKGYGGTTTSLGRLLPSLDKATLASGDMHKVLAAAAGQTKGAMSEAANTAAGKFDRMQVSINEAKESLGAALLPVMAKFASMMARVGALIAKHSTTFQVIAVIIAVVAAAIIALNAALSIYDAILAVTEILETSTWAAAILPVVLVVAAVAAVIAVFVLLYKKVKFFRDFVNATWAAIKTATRAAASVFREVWNVAVRIVKAYFTVYKAAVLLVFNAIKAAVRVVVGVFKDVWRAGVATVRTILTNLKEFFTGLWNTIAEPVRTAIGTVRTVIGNAYDWISNKWGGLEAILTAPWDAVVSVIDKIRDGVQWVIDNVSRIHIPSVGGILGSLNPFAAPAPPGVPAARGVGAAVPMGTSGGAAARGGVTINVNGAIDPENTARQIRRILAGHDRRVGLRTA